MHFLLQLILIVVAFISHEHKGLAKYIQPYTSIVIPIHKHTDAVKPLYSVEIMTSYVNSEYMKANFLIDIDAPLIWHDCILQSNIHPGSCPSNTLCTSPVSCEQDFCTVVRDFYSYKNPSCAPVTNSSTLPGWAGHCTCPVNVLCPVTGACVQALLNNDDFTVNTSNGRNVFTGLYGPSPTAACAPSTSFGSFPKNVTGVMAFSSSPYALPAVLSDPLQKILALCLPSNSSAPGVLFFGTGPYSLSPHSDVRSLLTYTSLLKQPDSFGYFIRVKSILIKNMSIDIPEKKTTKFSTTEPYTKLTTSIYKQVVEAFAMETIGIPRAKPLAPFELCFGIGIGSGVGVKFPDIDFSLPDGKKWRITNANSVKQVTKEVACLAIVDGGVTSEYGIVIGSFQVEDNFLLFDLEKSRFGFSSSLLSEESSCANFNFTLTDIS